MGNARSLFSRKAAIYKPMPKVLVLCEDTKSCLDYLNDAGKYYRANVKPQNCGKTDPLGIVNAAKHEINRKKYDRVFCVIDRDSHENFDQACELAKPYREEITLITSFPCYEFWLYLHFKQDRSPIGPGMVGGKSPGDRMLSKIKQIPELKNYSKSDSLGLFDYLQPQLKTAFTHAAWVLNQAETENNPDPSTRIHLLLNEFKNLGEPQPITA